MSMQNRRIFIVENKNYTIKVRHEIVLLFTAQEDIRRCIVGKKDIRETVPLQTSDMRGNAL